MSHPLRCIYGCRGRGLTNDLKYNGGENLTLKDVDAWLNLSKSGAGVNIRIGDKFYVTSVKSVQAVLKGEKVGAKLSLSEKTEPATPEPETNQ